MSSRPLGLCSVCDANAVGINFAVPTCAPCKAFFRRNAVKLGSRDYVCQQDGDCLITYKSRRLCNCCRLAKCFRVGMQKSLIRSEAEREARKQLVEQNRKKRVQPPPRVKTLELIRPSNLLLLTHSQSKSLSLSDQTLLTNISGAYERTCIAATKVTSPAFPTSKHARLHTFLNEYTERQKALVRYFKLIPEFDRVSINDKIRLIRNHFCVTLTINEATLSSSISQQLIDSVSFLFDANISAHLLKCITLIHSYTSDRMLLKLLLIVKSLSSGINRYRNDTDMDRIYDNTLEIFAAQNIYVELLWKYLLSRFPSELHVVKFYNKLIQDLMFTQRVCFMTESHINNRPHEIQRMEPLIQSMWPTSIGLNNSDDTDIHIKKIS
ncbi:unnamed protein product [Adineta steineri]|uniref:Nuclear receptor domain-containing protein n=2 Tax=Adineta steineri TaxID=433720 RepID=A0A818X6G7_9BILA|nr:unnamed protein product [Adineta steineri]CAF1226320.1 unnamed protein product [Adineta steineri]CAF3733158.1 unnamed protein product [Adineta steineri]